MSISQRSRQPQFSSARRRSARRASRHDEAVIQAEMRRLSDPPRSNGILNRHMPRTVSEAEPGTAGRYKPALSRAVQEEAILWGMTPSGVGLIEHRLRDGSLCLAVSGELDLATVGQLRDRLRSFSATKTPVRLDLSRVDFIDSAAIAALLDEIKHARLADWDLVIDRAVSAQASRLIELIGVNQRLWPEF